MIRWWPLGSKQISFRTNSHHEKIVMMSENWKDDVIFVKIHTYATRLIQNSSLLVIRVYCTVLYYGYRFRRSLNNRANLFYLGLLPGAKRGLIFTVLVLTSYYSYTKCYSSIVYWIFWITHWEHCIIHRVRPFWKKNDNRMGRQACSLFIQSRLLIDRSIIMLCRCW